MSKLALTSALLASAGAFLSGCAARPASTVSDWRTPPHGSRSSSENGSIEESIALDLSRLRGKSTDDEPSSLPRGVQEQDGVSLGFARADESWRIRCRGQSVPFDALEGGRYYDLHLALVDDLGSERAVTFTLVCKDGRTRPLVLHMPARDAASTAAYTRIDAPLAADFSIDGLRLPDDEHLSLAAAGLTWHRNAPSDSLFRRAWLAREMNSPELARYFRDLKYASLAGLDLSENQAERMLFDLALRGDKEAYQKLLTERLDKIAELGRNGVNERVHACLCLDPRLEAPEVDGRELFAALRSLCDLLEQDPARRGALGSSSLLARCAAEDASTFARLKVLLDAGQLELAGAQWITAWKSLPDERALAQSFVLGQRFLDEQQLTRAALPGIRGDFGWAIAFPRLCVALGWYRAVAWADANQNAQPPAVFGWKGALGAGIVAVGMPAEPGSLGAQALAERLAAARASTGLAEILVPLAVGGAVERELAELSEATATDFSPELTFSTPSQFLAHVRAAPQTKIAVWQPPAVSSDPLHALAHGEIRAANQRAQAELDLAERFGALARADGLLFLEQRFRELWLSMLSNLARSDAGALVEAERITAEARESTQAALGVLMRAADTRGEGQALLVFNALPWERDALVECECAGDKLVDDGGRAIATQRVALGVLLFSAHLPAFGYAVFHATSSNSPTSSSAAPGSSAAPAPSPFKIAKWTFSNEHIAFTIDPEGGQLTSLRELPKGEELIYKETNLLAFARDEHAEQRGLDLLQTAESVEVVESGPVRLVVRIVRKTKSARMVQNFVLERDAHELVIENQFERMPEHGSLIASFVLAHSRPTVLCDVPFALRAVRLTGRDPHELIPMQSFVVAGDERAGLLFATDTGACFGGDGQELCIELWNGALAGAERARTTRLVLRPLAAGWTAGQLSGDAAECLSPALPIASASHPGARPARHSFVELSRLETDGARTSGPRAGLELVSMRPSEDGREWILMIVERGGRGGEARMGFDRTPFGAERVGWSESVQGALGIHGKQFGLPLEPGSISNLRVRWRP